MGRWERKRRLKDPSDRLLSGISLSTFTPAGISKRPSPPLPGLFPSTTTFGWSPFELQQDSHVRNSLPDIEGEEQRAGDESQRACNPPS